MQMQLLALSMAAVVLAVPAPEPTPAAVERQILGGGLGGIVGPSIGGGLTGHISKSVLDGCIGGYFDGKGTTLCTTITVHPHERPTGVPHHGFAENEAEIEERQLAGSLGGYVGSDFISGTISGEVASTGLAGCIGGAIPFAGHTLCLGIPFPAKATPTAAASKA